MTGAHIIYIPMVVSVGMFLGFFIGSRAARNAYDLQRRRDAERDKVRAEREARKKAQANAEE
jgi:hypothetical protein